MNLCLGDDFDGSKVYMYFGGSPGAVHKGEGEGLLLESGTKVALAQGRHCHSTLPSTVIDCHSLGV